MISKNDEKLLLDDELIFEDDIVDEYDPIDDEIIVNNFKGFREE